MIELLVDPPTASSTLECEGSLQSGSQIKRLLLLLERILRTSLFITEDALVAHQTLVRGVSMIFPDADSTHIGVLTHRRHTLAVTRLWKRHQASNLVLASPQA
jgi:hypothetical protein